MDKPHKKFDAWKVAMDLVLDVYRSIEKFPKVEKYGLVDQMRRATSAFQAISQKGRRGIPRRNLRSFFISLKHR